MKILSRICLLLSFPWSCHLFECHHWQDQKVKDGHMGGMSVGIVVPTVQTGEEVAVGLHSEQDCWQYQPHLVC